MTLRVLLLSQWFDPEPTPKGLAFAKELARLGFQVGVVTGYPNYPGGRLYPGYRLRLIRRENIDGISIIRVPLYPSHDGSAFRRTANYASFALAALTYCLLGSQRPDIIYAYHPPLTVGIVAGIVRYTRGVPVVFDMQDMWPDTLRATGMVNSERLLALVGKLCHWVYKRMDRIVVLSKGFKDLLVERGIPRNKIETIYNWCDETSILEPECGLPKGFPGAEYFRVLFAGTMGKAQALEKVIDAAEIVSTRNPSVRFIFVGGGIEVTQLKERALEKRLSNIVFLPRVPMSQVGAILKEADALLVHLRDDFLFRITIPSKTQAYMAVGKPVLMAVAGDAADLINSAGCGITAESEHPESIASAVIELSKLSHEQLDLMGNKGREFYSSKLSLKRGSTRFAEIFRDIAQRK